MNCSAAILNSLPRELSPMIYIKPIGKAEKDWMGMGNFSLMYIDKSV